MTTDDSLIVQSHPGVFGEDDRHAHRKWRERQAWRTGRMSILAKFVSVGARLITIPLSLRLLGTERYGLWLTVGSLLTWLVVYDLGLSSGLLNVVATAYGRGDAGAIRRHVSTALLGFASMSLAMLAVVAGGSHWVGLPRLLGIASGSPLAPDARALVLVCGVIFAASFTLNGANQLAGSLQCGYVGAYGQISAVVLSCALLVVMSFRGASVVQFALVMGVPPLLGGCATACYLFLVPYRDFQPSIRLWSFASLRAISGCGTPIFLGGMADMAIVYSANLLIAHRLGPGVVPSYAVPYSGFMMVCSLCYGLVTPYQAAYAEALARGDREWIRRTAIRVLSRNLALMGAFGLGAIAFGGLAIRFWTRGRVLAPRAFLGAMAVYFVCMVWTSANGILLIGIGRVKTNAALHACVAAVYLPGALLLLPRLGVIALPIAGAAGYLIDGALSLPLALRHLRRIAGQHAATPAKAGRGIGSDV
jgi:O-antigen/teichoic acid export membrane protein